MCDATQKPLTSYSGPCTTPCGLGALLGSAATPFVAPSGDLPSTLCCRRRLCQRLKFVVICPTPWTRLPGAPPTGGCITPDNNIWKPNQTPGRCQVPITGGTPWCLQLNGSPMPVNVYDQPPAEVLAAYPGFKYRSIVFDFGSTKSGRAEGKLVAMGGGGCIQACLKFEYGWCGPAKCKDETLPQFKVTSNTGVNARFTVLDPAFLSSDPCKESIVVVQIQQWCCDATRCRTGRAPGEEVLDAPWALAPLSCLEKKLVPSCGPPCLASAVCPGTDTCCPPYTEGDLEYMQCGDGILREKETCFVRPVPPPSPTPAPASAPASAPAPARRRPAAAGSRNPDRPRGKRDTRI